MIAIFTCVGLGLFGSGLYAIYDGWPYLVLERGFTEIIIGTIAATGGLILLALAWVLRELKGLKRELAMAAALREPREVPAQPAPVSAGALPDPVEPVTPTAPAVGVPVPGAAGLAAGAAMLGAGAGALAGRRGDAEAEEADLPASSLERDLFGKLVEEHLVPEEPQTEPSVAEPAPVAGVADMFADVEPVGAVEPSFERPEDDGASGDESFDETQEQRREAGEHDEVADDFAAAAALSSLADEPLPHEAPLQGDASAPEADDLEFDEFRALRESLTAPLGPTRRIEPSLAVEPDPFAAAEAWMAPDGRREPRFDEAPVSEPTVDEATLPAAAMPVWPPRTEPTASPVPDDHRAEEGDVATGSPEDEDATQAGEPAQAEREEEPAPPPPAAAEPAASEEGVVGAYQVGDAHFTIYADGSIRARTPDGEYSFASMDELKVYLASEKSRLGV